MIFIPGECLGKSSASDGFPRRKDGTCACLLSHRPSHQRSSTMNVQQRIHSCSISALVIMVAGPAFADCSALPNFSQLRSALSSAITPAAGPNGGLGFQMWGAALAHD